MKDAQKQELIQLRWKFEQLQKLTEAWHADEGDHPVRLECARQVDAILQKNRRILDILWPAFVFGVFLLLAVGFLACRFRR